MSEPTIQFYAMTVEAAKTELGLATWDDKARFVVVEHWIEADQYELSGGYATRESLLESMSGESFLWY